MVSQLSRRCVKNSGPVSAVLQSVQNAERRLRQIGSCRDYRRRTASTICIKRKVTDQHPDNKLEHRNWLSQKASCNPLLGNRISPRMYSTPDPDGQLRASYVKALRQEFEARGKWISAITTAFYRVRLQQKVVMRFRQRARKTKRMLGLKTWKRNRTALRKWKTSSRIKAQHHL